MGFINERIFILKFVRMTHKKLETNLIISQKTKGSFLTGDKISQFSNFNVRRFSP